MYHYVLYNSYHHRMFWKTTTSKFPWSRKGRWRHGFSISFPWKTEAPVNSESNQKEIAFNNCAFKISHPDGRFPQILRMPISHVSNLYELNNSVSAKTSLAPVWYTMVYHWTKRLHLSKTTINHPYLDVPYHPLMRGGWFYQVAISWMGGVKNGILTRTSEYFLEYGVTI